MSRIKFTAKNIVSGYVYNIISLILGFVSRTIFLRYLSVNYLGVNGLFTNILGVLSFAELGFGTAVNYSLYKPVAENDIEKIKSLMLFYKSAYRVIALTVTVIGLLIFPFLNTMVKDPGDVGDISIYYLIFLFNTVSSYFVGYKYSIVNAEQKNYIASYIRIITSIITTSLQIIILIIFRDFLLYLLVAAAVELIQKIFVSIYLNKKYPYLLDKNVDKLDKQELQTIRKNVFALLWYKFGSISITQTDNIIISAFINITTVGILSNYNLIIASVNGFISIIFKSAISSLGNLIATEDTAKQYYIFKIYRFIAFWLYGFSSIAFFILLSPFITLWLDKAEMVIPEITLLLIVINYYMNGLRLCIINVSNAGGLFVPGKYLAIIQGVVNLIVSVVMVKLIGLPGVFIGTLVQGFIGSTVKPMIVFKHIFKANVMEYFKEGLKYAFSSIVAGAICWIVKSAVMHSITILNFIIMMGVVAIIPNVVFFLIFRKNEGLIYIKNAYNMFMRGKRRAQLNG